MHDTTTMTGATENTGLENAGLENVGPNLQQDEIYYFQFSGFSGTLTRWQHKR